MKRLFFIFFVIISYNYSHSQTLKDIFIQLSKYDNLSKDDKELMIKNFYSYERGYDPGVGSQKYYLSIYEPNNGFLSYGGAGEFYVGLVYWNLSNGGQLIAYYHQTCGPICDENIKFFRRHNSKLIYQELFNILPTVTINDFIDIDKMINDGLNVDEIIKSFYSYDLGFILPQKGKNLIIDSQYIELFFPKEYEEYKLGQTIELVWNDGTFIKQE
ncbi:hypothetical protein [Mangrovivirga cuniculi]|uniref:Uncharacterized protein n=1 Tax=Mangrovivirga cuniculi TaxID=2715131 RepID=A0A4D7K8G7_9BACT|nr:hypothetical protein [Mangrovivirga cuniculi]QCK15568.1 hypothetical protein DCC35_12835 [Mangrovivirga cuniculi]